MKVEVFNGGCPEKWDNFVLQSRRPHFMFHRGYMEYHSDRFDDYSLCVYDEKGKLLALLPANKVGTVLHSHQGLTFGGFITLASCKMKTLMEIFSVVSCFLKERGFTKIRYKVLPEIYAYVPSQEELYALFRSGAKLMRRDVSCAIYMEERLPLQNQRKRAIKKAISADLVVKESSDLREYWSLLEMVLQQAHVQDPTHGYTEIETLKKLFQSNIRLFCSYAEDGEMLAGTLVYETPLVAHTQYLACSEKGRDLGALDLVISHLMEEVYKGKKYLDFGISNEQKGRYLNEGLMSQKEGFGGRAVVHDFYDWELN